jgi:hypothetical protein
MNKKRYIVIGGIVVVAVVVSVLLYTMLGNQRPVIASVQAEPQGVAPLGSCQIVCAAADPNGDELSYNWTASGGEITGQGATVTWTAPSSSGSCSVAVEVTDGRGGKVTGQVSITVRTNHPPVITSLVPSANWTTPSGTIQLMCSATDVDHDVLSYEWTVDGGDISGTGAAVNWTAPDEIGVYDITVKVKDGYGGEAVGELGLSVNHDVPPTVEKLVITPVNNIYLRNSTVAGCDFDVYKDKYYTIECVASNASGELSYQWSSTDGELSGEGETVTWISPDKLSTGTVNINATVTVIVSDGAGNSIARSVVFHMASCTCGSWPLKSGEVLFS